MLRCMATLQIIRAEECLASGLLGHLLHGGALVAVSGGLGREQVAVVG